MTRMVSRAVMNACIVAAVVGLSEWHAIRNGYDYTDSFRFMWSVLYIGLLALVAYGCGLPDVARSTGQSVVAAVQAVVLAGMAISIAQLAAGSALLPRSVVLGVGALLVPCFAACAVLAKGGHNRAEERDRVFVVARPDEVEALKADLALFPERPATVVATMSPSADGDVLPAGDHGNAAAVLGRAVEELGVTVVVLSRDAQSDDALVHAAAKLHAMGVRVRTFSLFYEQWLGKLPVGELERASLLFDISELHRAVYARLSRLLDLALALFGAIAVVVVLPFVWLGNLVANRGPLFYRQPRVGKGGSVFRIVKFRTMRPLGTGVSAGSGEWTSEDDPRITPFGRVLRRSHLDELPQMLNVLRGELSIVGPRPEQPHYVEELVAKLPFYNLRHLVRPGITGWAQVKYGYAGNEHDALEKLQYEFFYLRNQSLAFDLRIIARTLRSVIGRRGR